MQSLRSARIYPPRLCLSLDSISRTNPQRIARDERARIDTTARSVSDAGHARRSAHAPLMSFWPRLTKPQVRSLLAPIVSSFFVCPLTCTFIAYPAPTPLPASRQFRVARNLASDGACRPVRCKLRAVATASPKKQYRGRLSPSTPLYAAPLCSPIRTYPRALLSADSTTRSNIALQRTPEARPRRFQGRLLIIVAVFVASMMMCVVYGPGGACPALV
eukprot:1428957-Rhodomonas_salina.2